MARGSAVFGGLAAGLGVGLFEALGFFAESGVTGGELGGGAVGGEGGRGVAEVTLVEETGLALDRRFQIGIVGSLRGLGEALFVRGKSSSPRGGCLEILERLR